MTNHLSAEVASKDLDNPSITALSCPIKCNKYETSYDKPSYYIALATIVTIVVYVHCCLGNFYRSQRPFATSTGRTISEQAHVGRGHHVG